MRKVTIFGLGLLVVLTGCGSNAGTPGDESNGSYYVEKVTVDGEPVTCVVWSGIEKGGVSCDFDGQR